MFFSSKFLCIHQIDSFELNQYSVCFMSQNVKHAFSFTPLDFQFPGNAVLDGVDLQKVQCHSTKKTNILPSMVR